MMGTIDTWVIWNLTGGCDGGSFVTDVTNASRTMLMNLHTRTWDDKLLSAFNLPLSSASMLPSIRSSAELFGRMNSQLPQSCRNWIRERRRQQQTICQEGEMCGSCGIPTTNGGGFLSEMPTSVPTPTTGIITDSATTLITSTTTTTTRSKFPLERFDSSGGGVEITVRDYISQKKTRCFNGCTTNSGCIGEMTDARLYVQQRMYDELLEETTEDGGWQMKISGASISGCVGDQQSACIGHRLFKTGAIKCTYGTGAFVLINTGDCLVTSTEGLLTTPCYQLGYDQPVRWALEGSVGIAGGGVRWLKDNLGVINSDKDTEAILDSTPSTDGVLFVPAFSGLLAPHWRSDARGCIVGLTLSTRKEHIVRALLEGIALQIHDLVAVMRREAKSPPGVVCMCVDGGMSRNTAFLQLTADLVNLPIVRPADIEVTSVGAAIAAAVGDGLITAQELIEQEYRAHEQSEWRPSMSQVTRQQKLTQWTKAMQASLVEGGGLHI
eukprot:GHVS01091748.1.p1 GENE.GHVS01091748.1~~GHVS01091748.1.p1  ORF type:complete len:496 (+),score=74.89 GHVS01091748.1:500-1987(+)